MRILELRALRGPNVWSQFATIYMRLDLEDFAERPTNTFPGLTDLVMKLLPSIHAHRCGVGRVGGFESRMREGTYLGHVIEHIAIGAIARPGDLLELRALAAQHHRACRHKGGQCSG